MATYPNEVWPGDGAVELLDGTLDVETGLPYVAKGTGPTSSPTYEVQYNRRLQRQNRILASVRAGMVVAEAGLYIGAYPAEYMLGGVQRSFAGASGVAVPDNAERVVYLDASGALQVAADWPTDLRTFVPLAEVTTDAGSVTVRDVRSRAMLAAPEFSGEIGAADLSGDLAGRIPQAVLTVGAELADQIPVIVQIRDANGDLPAGRFVFRAWLSDGAGGVETADAPDGAVAWTTGTALDEKTAKAHWRAVMTNDSGQAILNIGESGDQIWYLNVELDGTLYVSGPINFD